jgi:hypothetical protein
VNQIVEKGFLEKHIAGSGPIRDVIHFEPSTTVLAVEDPKFVVYIRNLAWNDFAEKVGFINVRFEAKYDFALSFAGADRPVAERLFELLSEEEFEVFYDRNEQHRILAEDIEEYLAPIYRSEAMLVVALLGPDYPKKIWTKFESDQFRERFGEGAVVPVWFTTAPPGAFDETRRVGGFHFNPDEDLEAQLQDLSRLLKRKMAEKRATAAAQTS